MLAVTLEAASTGASPRGRRLSRARSVDTVFKGSEQPPSHERRVASRPPHTPRISGVSWARVLRGLPEVLGTHALRRPEPQFRRWSVRLFLYVRLDLRGRRLPERSPGPGDHPGHLSQTAPCSRFHPLALGQVSKCHLESHQCKGHCHASLLPLGDVSDALPGHVCPGPALASAGPAPPAACFWVCPSRGRLWVVDGQHA